jgi:predicted RNase H-like HicB family nuclease
LTAFLEPDEIDGGWVASYVVFPGACLGRGQTQADAVESLESALLSVASGDDVTARMVRSVLGATPPK